MTMAGTSERAAAKAADTGTAAVRIRIGGMSCASCVSRIEKAIRAVPGVTSAAVNFAAERVDVNFSDASRPLAIVKAIEDAGYDAVLEPVELAIEGMSCALCVGSIDKALKSVLRVLEASGNPPTNTHERAEWRVKVCRFDV